MIHDAYGYANTADANNLPHHNEEPNLQAQKFYQLLEDAETELYPGCKSVSKLSFVVRLLHLKCINHWTNKSMDDLLSFFKEVLPVESFVPNSFYEAKKVLRDLGLGYTKIDACQNDCILYWREHANAQSCPKCGESRWKSKENGGKKVAHKVLRHFPIKPRLQRLYMARETAKKMRWHKEERVDDDHPWRKNRRLFDGKVEKGVAPSPLTGDDVLMQLRGFGNVNFGKGQKRKHDIERAVGPGSRDIVNYYGLIMCSTISFRDGDWQEIITKHGDAMWLKVKDKFEATGVREHVLQALVVNTMKRLFRTWKTRLHVEYSRYATDEERLSHRPSDVTPEDWVFLLGHFGSPEFKAVSERNKINRGKQITKHSCGSKSFAEVEESTRNPVNGQKAPPDRVWELQHTRKNDKEELVWSDPQSQQIHGQLQEIVEQQQFEENPMNADEILVTVLGERTGYVRGKGYGKRPAKKSRVQQVELEASMSSAMESMRQDMQAETDRKLQEEREQAVELQRKLEEQMAAELSRKLEDDRFELQRKLEEDRAELQKKLEEERAHMNLQLDKRFQQQMATMMARIQK
ncbi:hypothetical protein A4A49_06472 [Nicotiana attenuata]|uniref:Transposase-associated domain-containing protein n=1 Tax=Nicotiana attenuata TaxID=49451 RepID=A0A314L669_NICAT|nr:hypothetical protein A4A49_06472 [Nicotiana attenuata]